MTEDEELAAIVSVLKTFSGGAAINTIRKELNEDIPIYTLQRRLNKLIKRGLIVQFGQKRGAYYKAVLSTTYDVAGFSQNLNVPLPGSDAKSVLDWVSQPIEKRLRVSYNRQFLDSYVPNSNSYLNANDREVLLGMGTTNVPGAPAGTYARQILNRLLIDLSFNSSRLEGNTYSLLDTQRLLVQGSIPENKSPADAQMLFNHKDAIEFLVHEDAGIGINRYTILNLHALLSNNLLPDPAASGRLRTFAVGINHSTYTPVAIPQLIEELFAIILEKASSINDPFEQSFFLMVHLPYLQPFDDVNKRVSRLAANIPLNAQNLAPLSFTDVPQDMYMKALLGVYEMNRIELLKWVFIDAYKKSAAKYAQMRQTIGEPEPFRIQYRNELRILIGNIIKNTLTPAVATETIAAAAAAVTETDRTQFKSAAETELLALHEGNFARYQVTPAEFRAWKAVWDKMT